MQHRLFITGDKHGSFQYIEEKLKKANITANDVVIVLGDHGTLFYSQKRDRYNKNKLSGFPCSFIFIKGNHDRRPTDPEYSHRFVSVTDPAFSGRFYQDADYPKLFYTEDFGWYRFGHKNTFVIGGAYSVDKFLRLNMTKRGYVDYKWFEDEQLSKEEQANAKALLLQNADIAPFVIMSHTCPHRYKPFDRLTEKIPFVDETMEYFLDDIESSVNYEQWYCGHWHIDRTVDKLHFLYDDLLLFDEVDVSSEKQDGEVV